MRLIDADEVCVQMELSSPISDEQWAFITDAELERTSEITFNTPSGKKVVFIKKPTVDAVEVVRCKDCAFRFTACPMVVRGGSFIQFFTDDGDYCSYGERRENDGSD